MKSPETSASFEARKTEIDRLFSRQAAKGGSFIVRYDLGKDSFVRAYGHSDCARTKPLTTDAVIDSGSITKAFTYAAAYKLIEGGRLKLDDRLDQFFPDAPADKRAITIAHLLDGQSGLHDFIEPDGTVPEGDVEVIVHDYAPLDKERFVQSALSSPLRFAPGTKEEYSNLAYQLVAVIIEAVSKVSYEAYVREQILLPAGMKDTGYVLPDYRGKVFAEQCKGSAAWGDPVTKGLWKDGVSWNLVGAGGMMTTVQDLKRWTEAAVSGNLFRPDIQSRFRRSPFFETSYQQCGTEISAVAGSNGLTTVAYFHKPLNKEVFILASTRSDQRPPQREIFSILCPPGRPA